MKDTLASIKTCERIIFNGIDVLIRGKSLWQFRSDGEFVRKIPIRHPYRIAFLPNRRVFIDGIQRYYYLSLETGEALWAPDKARTNRSGESLDFAVSPDGSTVYGCFYRNERGKRVFYVERICPDCRLCQVFPVEEGLEVTASLFIDSEGTLCALQRQYITQLRYADTEDPEHSVHLHGILAIPFRDGSPQPYWKQQWEITDGGRYSFGRACDGTHILFEDYSVWNLETGEKTFLLDEADRETLPAESCEYTYDPARSLLTVQYIATSTPFDRQKVIIDCSRRKIVARYLTEEPCSEEENPFCGYSVGYRGCLVGDSFWIGTATEGVVRLPFPNSTPPVKRPTPEEENASWWRFVRETRQYRKPDG